MKIVLYAFMFLFLAQPACAAVRFSEIAWMGNASSSANEWIELTNDASFPVDLSGWSIRSSDGGLRIALRGSIAANGYFLIERTNDNVLPEVAADLVASFGKGISNSGEILQLFDASGALVDTVDGSNQWQSIGGNNKTKMTAQRTASGWITAVATPRASTVSTVSSSPVSFPPSVRPVVGRPAAEKQFPSHPEQSSTATIATSSSAKIATVDNERVLWSGSNAPNSSSSYKNAALIGIGVLLFFCAGYLLYRSWDEASDEADRYEIIEDSIEGKDD